MASFMMRLLLSLLTFFIVVVGGPFLLLALAFWAADGSWDFEGKNNLRYWMFVKGSRIERLGAVEPVGPLRYSVSMQEGTFPGWSVAQYDSRALPETILEAYAERCRDMKFRITERTLPVPDRKPNAIAGLLICEIEPYIDVELFAERADQAATTQVGIKVWGDK